MEALQRPVNPCNITVSVHLAGFWSIKDSEFLPYPLTRLLLQLALIFSLTQSLHFLLKRFRLPRITSEILAGIILGPTGLGQIPKFRKTLFPPEGDIFLDALSKFGFIFFIFLSGVKMNPRLLMTAGAGSTAAWTIGVVAPSLPFAGGLQVLDWYKRHTMYYRWPTFKSLMQVQNLFAFPVIFSLLDDLKIMNSELGRLALSSTLISDLVSTALASIASNLRIGYAGWKNTVSVFSVLMMLTSVLVLVLLIQPLSKWIIQQTPEGRPVHRVYVIFFSAVVLISAIFMDNFGLIYQIGPFVLGLALPDGPPLGSTLVQKLETLIYGLFLPLLVTYCGMKVDMVQLYDLNFITYTWGLIAVCLVMKFVAIVSSALASKMPVQDAFALAFIMSTQGNVQMVFYFNNSIRQILDGDAFSMATFSVLLIASAMQFCAHSLYDHSRMYAGYQKRDIQHVGYNAELRVLASFHQADDALAAKRILDVSFPNRESPLAVYALTLVELVGRAQPLLINHQLGQKSSAVGPHTQKIHDVFQQFREQYMGMVTVQMFTAMSLPRFMHDDVCSLALDKMTSIIILPFHRKWNTQGKMISDNGSARTMNCNVLDMAPCSVAILVDRHRIKSSSSMSSPTYNVAVVFVGGNDDREALAYGKRMARSPAVHLTIVRFVTWDLAAESQWDAVMDAEVLKEMRLHSAHQVNIVYREEKVKDGADTALQIHAIEDEFDLIMVGRRHREDTPQLLGLNEWSDLPELGPIGDMLASAEVNKPVSVLIVQQQILRIK